MRTVRRISPGSAFKIGLAIYGAIGLIVGIFAGIIGIFSLLFPAQGQPSRGAALIAVAVGAPILYAIIGAAMAALMALIYNLAARWAGGLQVEVD